MIIVEDDRALRELMTWSLESYGVEIESVEDSRGAIQAIERGWPDCLILDLSLAEESGEEVIATIQRRFRRPPPILILSGLVDAQERGARFPDTRVLEKPFVLSELLAVLADLMKISGQEFEEFLNYDPHEKRRSQDQAA